MQMEKAVDLEEAESAKLTRECDQSGLRLGERAGPRICAA